MTERDIKMAAKLYECRDTAKKFFRNEYTEKLKPYTTIIEQVMAANKIDVLPALLKVSQTQTYQDSAIGQMLFMAAAVELIEPSK